MSASLLLWKFIGKVCLHSIDDLICLLEIIIRWDLSISHVIKINIIIADEEIIAPVDDTIFHIEYVSG